MSLRQKGIEVLFTDFVKKYLPQSGYHLPKDMDLARIVQLVPINQLYRNTIAVVEDFHKRKEKNSSVVSTIEQDFILLCDLIHNHFKLSRLYSFSINPNKKTVVMTYGFPEKTTEFLTVNSSFINKLKGKQNLDKIVELIKDFFQVDFIDLDYQVFFENDNIRFLLYHRPRNIEGETYRQLFDFIFNYRFYSFSKSTPNPLPKEAADKSASNKLKGKTKKAGVKEDNQDYQKLVGVLPLSVSNNVKNITLAVKTSLQVGGFTQAAVCDMKKKQVFGFYSLSSKPRISWNNPNEWGKQFEEIEKKYQAVRVKTKTGKYLLLFFNRPLLPDKKTPDFPFSGYQDFLEKILIKRHSLLKK